MTTPDTSGDPFDAADLDLLERRGVGAEEARRQLALMRRPPRYVRLERPCRAGDGLEVIGAEERRRLEALAREAASAGRLIKFVPASGAATRMFQGLLAALAGGAGAAGEDPALREFLENVHRFAFDAELRDALARRGGSLDRLLAAGDWRPILEALLDAGGLGYARLPKALLAFHAGADGARTALEEHLVEAAALVTDASGASRIHLTVSPEHRAAVDALLRAVRPRWEGRLGCRFEVDLSVQSPATDTLALDDAGGPFRDAGGALLLRPAGHGALIENLAALAADLVLVKNVDNVAPERLKAPTYLWSRILTGMLLDAQRRSHELLRRLEDGSDAAAPKDALAFARTTLHVDPGRAEGPALRERLRDALDRPFRVCGMVPNAGEPGGGPFWARRPDGSVTLQIVESAELDPGDPSQQAIARRATHFNPVFMVFGLRDHRGRPHDPRRFADPDAAILTRKTSGGRRLLALERPGLWNGAMALWNTLFVEVPPEVFNPVKTIADLLRPEHQPA